MNVTDYSARPFLIFGAPLIEQAEIDEVTACMRSAWLGTGPRVAQFTARVRLTRGAGPCSTHVSLGARKIKRV